MIKTGIALDLNHYTWRVPAQDDDGNPRLLVPHADPQQYEFPINFIFRNVSDAFDWLEDQDLLDEAETEKWKLVHFVGTAQSVPRRGN